MNDLTHEEQMRIDDIIEHNSQFVNDEPIVYPKCDDCNEYEKAHDTNLCKFCLRNGKFAGFTNTEKPLHNHLDKIDLHGNYE